MKIHISRAWLVDVAERTGWTAAQAATGYLITVVTPLDTWWAAPIAGLLALAKGTAARHMGDPESAATLPRSGQ